MNAELVIIGSLAGIGEISADLSALSGTVSIGGTAAKSSDIVAVTLAADYTPEFPPGAPSRPPAGSYASAILPGKTLASGSVFECFGFEAATIVANGGGTL